MILSYRIHVKQYDTDEQFSRLLAFLKKHRAAIDEIVLFTEYWHHGYYPLESFAEFTRIISDRVEKLRQAGFARVGINMLDTLGHIDEAWDFLPPWPYPLMVGYDGKISKCSPCPTNPQYLEHIGKKYSLLAEVNTDLIWLDDDVRMQWHGGAHGGCFCPDCIKKSGVGLPDRESLVNQLNSIDGGEIRRKWVEHNIAVLDKICHTVEQAIHTVNTSIKTGFMSGCCDLYTGQAIPKWMETLHAKRLRPGGGFYDDSRPIEMVRKAFHIHRQCMAAPTFANELFYEFESFPYQKLCKSVSNAINECTLAFSSGCNGIAFNALTPLPGSLEDNEDLLNGIEKAKPFWNKLVDAADGLHQTGLWLAMDEMVMAKRQVANKDWFDVSDYDFSRPTILAEIGIPVTYDRRNSCGTILSGRIAELFTNAELEEMFKGGVLMDAQSLEIIEQRGLGSLVGVKIGRKYDNGVYERFTEHPFNTKFAGEARDTRISFWKAIATELVPLADSVADIARFVGYDDSDCGMSISGFTNAIGGRVAVLGYAPWTYLFSSAKRSQMNKIADWISGNSLPLQIEKTLHVVPFANMSPSRYKIALTLLNASFDQTDEFEIKLRVSCRQIYTLDINGNKIPMEGTTTDDALIVTVPNIEPWKTLIMVS